MATITMATIDKSRHAQKQTHASTDVSSHPVAHRAALAVRFTASPLHDATSAAEAAHEISELVHERH